MMANSLQLRTAAREIFEETLRAIDPQEATRAHLRFDKSSLKVFGSTINVENKRIYAIALGKAAVKMAGALDDVLGPRLSAGVITSSAAGLAAFPLASRWERFHGGHPEPNEASLAAARASFSLLEAANEDRALVIFLVSGGGSAMIEWPASDDVSIADLRAANKALVECGASIAEINSVRRAFSSVKGGKLAARAPNCEQVTLIVSDVPKGEEANVASGPTALPPAAPLALEVVSKYQLSEKMPLPILRAIERSEPLMATSGQTGEHFVLLDNESALEAAAEAAQRRGLIAEIARDITDQPVEEGCRSLLERLEASRAKHRGDGRIIALISGGEFACPVNGNGIGGRNLETALRLASSPSFTANKIVALCAGTDGIDGNSPAAGALVDSTTSARALAIDLDAPDFLRRSDAYSFFVALGDVIATGPTGTNVRDLRMLLAPA